MRIVITCGGLMIDDPARLDASTVIGVDETAFLRATGQHPRMYATGIADLTPGRSVRLLDVVAVRVLDHHGSEPAVPVPLDEGEGQAGVDARRILVCSPCRVLVCV